jgi:hypothetical protein
MNNVLRYSILDFRCPTAGLKARRQQHRATPCVADDVRIRIALKGRDMDFALSGLRLSRVLRIRRATPCAIDVALSGLS